MKGREREGRGMSCTVPYHACAMVWHDIVWYGMVWYYWYGRYAAAPQAQLAKSLNQPQSKYQNMFFFKPIFSLV